MQNICMKNRNLWLNFIMAVISFALGFFLGALLINLIQNYGFTTQHL